MSNDPERPVRPFTPRLAFTIVASVVGAIVAASAFAFDWAPRIGDALVTDAEPTWFLVGFVAFAIAVAVWVPLSWRSRTLHDEAQRRAEVLREEIERLEFDRRGLEQRLKDLEEVVITDPVTGTPNQTKLVRDFERITRSEHRWQAIFIDFHRFRAVNAEFGRLGGDRIIRHLARGMFESIRRNEFMYRLDDDPDRQARPPDDEPQELMYRLYSGGDEFLFLVQGDITDAIGLLNRLCTRVRELSHATSELVGGRTAELTFTAGIAPVWRHDTVETVRQTVEKCYWIARNGRLADGDPSDFWVYWPPEAMSGADTGTPPASTVLARNEQLFRRPQLDPDSRSAPSPAHGADAADTHHGS